MLKNVDGSWSKTKIGAFLVALAAFIGTVAGWVSGTIDPSTAIQTIATEVGGFVASLGLADKLTKMAAK